MKIAIALLVALGSSSTFGATSRRVDTPKQHVEQAKNLASKWQSDASLVMIRGGSNIHANGDVDCDISKKVGWYFLFYSQKADRFYYTVACGDKIDGWPASEFDHPLKNPRAISTDFADTPLVIRSVRKVQLKRHEKRCGAYAGKLLFGQPDDHGKAFSDHLLWDVYYQCAGDKEQSRRALLDGKTAKPL